MLDVSRVTRGRLELRRQSLDARQRNEPASTAASRSAFVAVISRTSVGSSPPPRGVTTLCSTEAAAECKTDGACWTKKLASDDPLIREKAAWELGRLKDKSTLDALAKALANKKSEPRSAAIMAYWQFGDKRAVEAIEKQLEQESSAADYIRVNEDLRRLRVHLKRS